MMTEIQHWLSNPKRDFASGVLLFNKYATKALKKSYAEYFNGLDASKVKAHDAPYNMLINKLTAINSSIVSNPEAFKDILAAITSPQIIISNQVKEIVALKKETDVLTSQLEEHKIKATQVEQLKSDLTEKINKIDSLSQNKKALEVELNNLDAPVDVSETPEELLDQVVAKNKELAVKVNSLTNQINLLESEIGELTEEKEGLESELEDLKDDLDEKDSDIETLQEELEQKSAEIQELKTDLESKGLKVVTDEDLPLDLKKKRSRIKEIIPLMAKVHAELSDLTLTNDGRKVKALELCQLDDERRALWDSIDEYLSGKDSLLAEDKTVEYSPDPVIRGMQIANRIKRVNENIRRNEANVEKHIKAKKPNFELRARNLVEGYRLELEQLESMLNDKK